MISEAMATYGGLAGLLVLLFWMIWVEPRWFVLRRRRIFLRKELKAPVRILHLSDTHFLKTTKALEKFFDELARESVDLVFLTGDIIERIGALREGVGLLKKLKPAAGFYAVFGNHDYYDIRFWDALRFAFTRKLAAVRVQRVSLIERAFLEAGIRILRNETALVRVRGTDILVHGLDDPVTRHADVSKIQTSIDERKINVLLSHSVDILREIGGGRLDVVFSGHTHGGQVCLPFWGPLMVYSEMGRRFVSGMNRYRGTYCSVSRGLATDRFLSIRLLCRPEAILLTLEPE